MSLINRRQILGSMLISFMPYTAFSSSNTIKISLAVYNDYLPLSQMKDGRWTGYLLDMAQRLVQQTPQTLEIDPIADLNWKRALRIVETGELQLLFEVSHRPDREEYMDFIGTTNVERAFLIVREDVKLDKVASFDDFRKFDQKIFLNSNMTWSDEFDKLLAEDASFRELFQIMDGTIATSEDYELQIARMISSRRIGGYFFTEENYQLTVELGNAEIDKGATGSRLKFLRVEAFGEPTTFVVVPQNMASETREIIYNNYKQSRADGSFDAIWSKWYNGRTPPPDITP